MTVPTPPASALSRTTGTDAEQPGDLAQATGTASHADATAVTAARSTAAVARTATAALPPARDPDPGPDPVEGTGQNNDPAYDDAPRRLRYRLPHRLTIGWHSLRPESVVGAPAPTVHSDATYVSLPPTADGGVNTCGVNTSSSARPFLPDFRSGLILGRDATTGAPVSIPAFSPDPLRLTLIGGRRLAQILLLRALALGAAAVVVSADPTAWQGFGQAATGEADRVVVLPEHRAVAAFGTAEQPALVLYDLGIADPAAPPQSGPWQTRLTVFSTLTEAARPYIEDCHHLLAQTPDSPDILALVHDGVTRHIHICPTPTERRAFGA